MENNLGTEKIREHLKSHFQKRSKIVRNIADLGQQINRFGVRLHYEYEYLYTLQGCVYQNSILFPNRLKAMEWLENCKSNQETLGFKILTYLITEV